MEAPRAGAEAFICDDESRLHWIERRAKESERFRTALGQVYIYPQLSDRAILRVERAAGVPLAELDRERRQRRRVRLSGVTTRRLE